MNERWDEQNSLLVESHSACFTTYTIRRRFRDFQTLQKTLSDCYPTVILPQLPNKSFWTASTLYIRYDTSLR